MNSRHALNVYSRVHKSYELAIFSGTECTQSSLPKTENRSALIDAEISYPDLTQVFKKNTLHHGALDQSQDFNHHPVHGNFGHFTLCAVHNLGYRDAQRGASRRDEFETNTR